MLEKCGTHLPHSPLQHACSTLLKSSPNKMAGLSEAEFFCHVHVPSDIVSDVEVAPKSRVHAGPQR
jgi:hypothetical protein